MPYLLDTNVLSELRKTRPDESLVSWFGELDPIDIYISVITLGEIRQGIERLRHRGDKDQADRFEAWLGRLEEIYGDRVVPITARVADVWGRINAKERLPVADGLIAATALAYRWTLATRNVKDVERSGVRFTNPFQSKV